MGSGSSNLKEGVKTFLGLAASRATLPSVVIDGANVSDAYRLTGVNGLWRDGTFEIVNPAPTIDVPFAINLATHAITVTLETTHLGVVVPITAAALVAALNLDADLTGKVTADLFSRDSDNAEVNPDDGWAPNDGSGAAGVAVPETPFIETQDLTGSSVEHSGFEECLAVLVIGGFEPASLLSAYIEGSDDNAQWETLINFGEFLDYTHASSVMTGHIKLSEAPRYLRAVSAVNGSEQWVEHSVTFIFSGGGYRIPAENTHSFEI